ncbi:MAG: aminoglycoside phosphotransferase family protein [Terriglobia bacterium]|jgi:5-methylthioribose kinase
MSKEPILLSAGNVKDYLAGHGLWPSGLPMSVRELGGGVSNTVLLVEGKGPGGEERRWVVKQSLEKLRVKDDWRSERSRIFREAEAIQALGPVLGPETVPQIVHVGHDDYLFVMTAAPVGSATWKEAMLEGQVNKGVARQAGKLLARMITASHHDPSFRTAFADRTVFDQLRIDPYYRTAAARHPDVRPLIQKLIHDSWQIRSALVHGDFSPKNMLVRDTHISLIDFEVVHWGDPAFDAGFLLNHLFLKAFHQPQFAGPYFLAAREFWGELVRGTAGASLADFETMTVRHLAALMLARIDGKSPVEYIRDEPAKEHARRFSKWLMLEGILSFEDTMSAARKTLEVPNREIK